MQTSQQPNKRKFFRCASAHQRAIAAIVLLVGGTSFGLLWLAANGKIDAGRWLAPCGFKQRFGLPCPTCGVTTSAFAFARGEFLGRDGAFYIQPAAALLCCVLVVVVVLAFLVAVFGIYCSAFERFFVEIKVKHIVLALLVIIAASWAVTLARALAAKG